MLVYLILLILLHIKPYILNNDMFIICQSDHNKLIAIMDIMQAINGHIAK